MKKFIAIVSLLFVFGLASAEEYSEGQIWSYKVRAGEEGSTVMINKVEENEVLGNIFHISLSGVNVKTPLAVDKPIRALPHFPVSGETLEASLLTLLGKSDPNPDYLEGYNTWKAAFDAGEAGVFDITIAEIVGVVEEAMNQ